MKRQLPSNLTVEPSLMEGLSDVAGQRFDNVALLKNPKRNFEETALQGSLSEQKGRFDSILSGTPLSVFYPFGNGNILESFRTQNTSPFTPQALPNRQMTHNCPITTMRTVKPYTSTLDAVSRYEIALEYMDDPNKMDTFFAPHVGRIQGSPMCILNPSTFNHALFELQMDQAKKNYDDYLLMTPQDYWDKWRIGGIVESEQMLDGSDSTLSSGVSSGSYSQRAGGYKLVNMGIKGPFPLYNYFGSNIKAGGKCYAIIKKTNIPTEYYLDNKPTQAALSGRHPVINRTPLIGNVQKTIKPYQMSFLCLPHGGKMPREARMYRDEREILRRDAIVIYLGTILNTPPDHVYRPISNYFDVDPATRRMVMDSRSHSDARDGYDHDAIAFMRLILDCDDGIGL